MKNIVPMGLIYGLKNPKTEEIFYVGATTTSLIERLRVHYRHLKEIPKRKITKKMQYLLDLDIKCDIVLLDIVIDDDLFATETEYIKMYKKINPNLTNMTDGGKGNYTCKYYSEKDKKLYGEKISKALKGRPKPKGFAENLSKQRKGILNPAAKPIKNGGIVMFDKEDKLIKFFIYGFEINDYFNNKNAYGNIYKYVGSDKNFPYGYKYKWANKCKHKI